MAAEPQRAPLHVVGETGEVYDLDSLHRRIAVLQDELDGANKDIAAWRVRYANLRRDKEAEARANPLWPRAVALFQLWKVATGHRRSEFDAARFEMCLPMLKRHPDELHHRAIAGIAFDAFVTFRRNGSQKKHDGWDLLYRNADKWEEMANRAPADWQARVEGWMTQSGKKKSGPTK